MDLSMTPVFDASPLLTGFPTTILFKGTPLAAISLTDVPLKGPPDVTNRV